MSETLDLICPSCKNIICNICLMTVDWMLVDYCRKYLNHVDSCKGSDPSNFVPYG